MAVRKVPTKPKRRTVSTLPTIAVQPGAIAASLSLANAGAATAEDLENDDASSAKNVAERRRQFLSVARKRFSRSADAESQLRIDMLEDMRFYNSEQWPDNILATRILDNRVNLTINRLPQFVRQVVNQARKSKPAIQVNPVDNGADPDTAEVYQGIIRHIERTSRAEIAYSTASEHQAIMGRGWWRLLADYARPDAMEQDIKIKRVMDAFSVYPDPSCSEPDHSDATFCFVVERIDKDLFTDKYGDEFASSATDFASIGDDAPDWLTANGIQVAEYFYVESTRVKIAEVLIQNGTEAPTRIVLDRDKIVPENLRPTDDNPTPNTIILKERTTLRQQVKWALINGVDVIEGNEDRTAGRDLPGTYIPVIPVIGEELIVNGVRNLRGMVRDAISPQQAYNFWLSSLTERLALASKAPVIAAAGQLEGHEDKWNQSNQRNFAYLEYNAIDVNGTLVGPPQRASYDPDISAALQMTMQADRDLKSVIGMFDASQEQSREQSGKAILARQQQGEEGTSHFLDNLARSIEHTGRILVEWIPVYYDKPRMLRINGLDEQPRDVVVHAGNHDAASDIALRNNINSGRPFDLGVGRYDVTMSIGASYASRRQESVEQLVALVQAYPAMMPVVGDILVGNMDWPGAKQLAERLKRMVPAEAKDPDGDQAEIPPEAQQQIAQLSAQLQQTMQALQEKDQIIATKKQELDAKAAIAAEDRESQERIEQRRIDLKAHELELNTATEKQIAMLESRLHEISLRLTHAHDERMVDANRAVPHESLNYKDTPPDVQRQLEAKAGLVPSTLPPPEPKPAAAPKRKAA